jgi:hypothetical protein
LLAFENLSPSLEALRPGHVLPVSVGLDDGNATEFI